MLNIHTIDGRACTMLADQCTLLRIPYRRTIKTLTIKEHNVSRLELKNLRRLFDIGTIQNKWDTGE